MGGCIERAGLLHHIGSGVNSKADEASHVEYLHNAVPAMPSEPLIVPRHILPSRYDVWLISLQRRQLNCSLCWQCVVAQLARMKMTKNGGSFGLEPRRWYRRNIHSHDLGT